MTEPQAPSRTRVVYRLAQWSVYLFMKLFFRLSWEGTENIPKEGGVIIASNHASYVDPPCVGAVVPREASFFAKKEIFSIPVIGRIISYVGNTIPVDRRGFNADSFREMLKRLKGGWAVVIFPEGTRTRNGEFLKTKEGAGMAAVHANVPVVPCWVEGSFRAKPFRSKITLHFLPPFMPGDIHANTRKEHYLLVSERIMSDIKNLYKKKNSN